MPTPFSLRESFFSQNKMRERGVKVTEDYVLMVFWGRTMVLPPKEQDQDQDDAYPQIKASHGVLERVPVLSEKVSDGGDHRHPERRSHEIEHSECLPRHAQNACQRSGEDAQAENESGKEHGEGAVTRKQFLAAFERALGNPGNVLIAFEQRTSSIVAEEISEIVAERGSAGSHDDDPAQMQLVFRIGQEAGEQERSLAG